MRMVRSTGEIAARFESMRIVHPLAEAAFEVFTDMRDCRRYAGERDEQPAGSFFAHSQAGKSTTIKMYLETKVVDDCLERGIFPEGTDPETVLRLQKLVVYISAPPTPKLKPLLTEILKGLGDPRPEYGNIPDQIYRAEKLIKALGVELLIVDELDHLAQPLPRGNLRREEASSAQNHLKTMLLKGYPVMFVGVPSARHKIFGETQLDLREMFEIKYEDLDYSNPDHRLVFLEYMANLGIIIKEKGIMAEVSDFISGDTLPCLFIAGGGLLGGATRVVRKAAGYAFRDKAAKICREHLVRAVDNYSIPKLCTYNPFVHGLRDISPPRRS